MAYILLGYQIGLNNADTPILYLPVNVCVFVSVWMSERPFFVRSSRCAINFLPCLLYNFICWHFRPLKLIHPLYFASIRLACVWIWFLCFFRFEICRLDLVVCVCACVCGYLYLCVWIGKSKV